MTLQRNVSKSLHQMGHAYCQFYSSFKEILDVAKQKPFDNTMMEALAIDPSLTKAVALAGAAHPTTHLNVPVSDDDATISKLGSELDHAASSAVLEDICTSQLVPQVEYGEKRKVDEKTDKLGPTMKH